MNIFIFELNYFLVNKYLHYFETQNQTKNDFKLKQRN